MKIWPRTWGLAADVQDIEFRVWGLGLTVHATSTRPVLTTRDLWCKKGSNVNPVLQKRDPTSILVCRKGIQCHLGVALRVRFPSGKACREAGIPICKPTSIPCNLGCVQERKREKVRKRKRKKETVRQREKVSVCVRERERGREKPSERERVCVFLWQCVFVCERERKSG